MMKMKKGKRSSNRLSVRETRGKRTGEKEEMENGIIVHEAE